MCFEKYIAADKFWPFGWRKLLQYIRWGMRREPDKNYVG